MPSLYAAIEPAHMAMFRFLLESYGHVGVMTVLDKYAGLIKINSTADLDARLRAVLEEIRQTVEFSLLPALDNIRKTPYKSDSF